MEAANSRLSRSSKILYLVVSYFLVTFIYHILKDLKDTLVITAQGSGAEVIPFLKVWVMLPAALGGTVLATRMINRFGRLCSYRYIILTLTSFYLLFTFVLYPRGDALYLHGVAASMQSVLPSGFNGLVMLVKYWVLTLFYVSAEFWSTMILSFLFWTFVHDMTTFEEAKDHYPLYLMAGSSSGIVSGFLARQISLLPYGAYPGLGSNRWEQALMIITLMVVVASGILLWCLSRISVALPESVRTGSSVKCKKKLTLLSSVREVFKNRHLCYIALMILGYHVTMNVVEVIWKGQVKQLHPQPADYNAYISVATTWIGILSIVVALATPVLIRLLTWRRVVLLAPLILCATSLLSFSGILSPWHVPVTTLAALGTVQVVLCRSAKYTFFDTCKEMAFIPLPEEQRVQGKAVIDGIGSRLGKSGASLATQGMIISFGTIAASAPYMGVLLLLVLPASLWASSRLGASIVEHEESDMQAVTA